MAPGRSPGVGVDRGLSVAVDEGVAIAVAVAVGVPVAVVVAVAVGVAVAVPVAVASVLECCRRTTLYGHTPALRLLDGDVECGVDGEVELVECAPNMDRMASGSERCQHQIDPGIDGG